MAVAVAAAVSGFIGTAVTVVKWIGAPIKRQFTYLCCFSSNITNLRNEAQQLELKAGDLQGKVDRARDDVRVISGEVENWLKEYGDIMSETGGILNEVPSVESGCLKLGARFSLSKRAKNTTDRLKELRVQCKFEADAVSQPGPPAAMKTVPLPATYHEFNSRKQIEEDIMTTLRGGDVNIMGICGMGGVGKTTMAGRIRNKTLENNVFDEAVVVVVGQSVDKMKIQLEIGRSLGLKELDEESTESRRQKLNERLSHTKRILLVLDDVWKKLELEEIGIPCNHKGCTILITSRNRNVFKEMDIQDQDVFGMKELSEEDAYNLFIGIVGPCVNDNEFNSIAKDLVKKCNGLPLALIAVGATLKDEMNERIWRNALRELEKVQPGIPEYIEAVYNSLKLSYDFLGSKEHKLVFLLCSLYPEDAHIHIEHLTYISMGLGIFEGNVEDARDWMYSLTKRLKNRSLLLDRNRKKDGDAYVRMHDVVRDFCKFIAKQEGHDCTWISVSQRFELPTTFTFPNLRLLFLICKRGNEEFRLDNNFLEGIKDLYVLSIEGLSLTSLPHTTQSLKNLKTLVLDQCWELETLTGVGELVNLEILICRGCRSIEELPLEMKELNRLKLLDLSRCGKLQRIGGGIISSLVALEELKMLRSFYKWEEGENARLREVEELKMLRWLEIEIEDPAALAAAEKMHLPSKLDRFHIRLSRSEYSPAFTDFWCNKKLELECKEEIYVGHWIETQLLPHTEALSLRGGNVDLAKCEKLRYLEFVACQTMKESFIMPMDGLEHLNLLNLPKLEKIWDDDRVSTNSFQNLKKLQLNDLPSLIYFGNDCLPQLEDLRIVNCEIMEQVFLWRGESQNSHHITKLFPKLEKVYLTYMPKLTSFYQGIEHIEFPQLRKLKIKRCEKMRSLVSKGMESNENNLGDSSSSANIHHLFCQPQEGLCGSLITSSIARNIVSLTKPTTKQHMNGDQRTLLFPKLEKLYLDDLSELESFCEWKCDVELPSLREVTIENCPKMKQVWKSSSIHQHNLSKDCLPQLKVLRIIRCKMMEQVFLWKSSNFHPVIRKFPKLEEVFLRDLPNLSSFYQGIERIEFPQLRTLDIERCAKKRILGGSRSSKASIDHLSCQPQEVSFGCPEYLATDWNPFFNDEIAISFLNGLEKIKISGDESRASLIPSSIARNLCNLIILTIEDCSEMSHVIAYEKKGIITLLQFPKLEEIILRSSPKLVSFCEWKCNVELPSLRKVKIRGCPNMKNLTSGSLNAPKLESFDTDMDNDLHLQVPFNSMKKLTFSQSKNPINCDKIVVSLFKGLGDLTISKYEGSMSLFPSSITESLVTLTTLTIEYCYEMIKVIEDDEEKENEVSSQRRRLFPQLQRLSLKSLFKLANFCEWKCDVELPSLMELRIIECRNMKSYTSGHLATPNLASVRVNDTHFDDVRDLNGLLQRLYEEKQRRR